MVASKFFASTAAKTFEVLFNASGADIRVHDEEKIPDQPVLYVVNHFTRIETTFLPSLIYRLTKKVPYSLADSSFFGSNFGRVLSKLGAISTADPDRNRILTGALLIGNMSVIIFPEGQMLKDKKLVEKGKYLVFNSGIRRPPHTGSALLALRSQFHRENIRQFYNSGNTAAINEYKSFFGFSDDDIKTILVKETYIVPVNITYYPIRAKKNAILKIAEKFIGTLSERFVEELEVEGTMLMEGVDIDVNFGDPIPVRQYIDSSKICASLVQDPELHLKEALLNKKLTFRKESIDLMYRYMRSIYSMTTVNHDHLFAFILSKIPWHSIDETDFKNRANYMIEKMQKLKLANFHTTLRKGQSRLQTDDFHDKYESFIQAAVEDNLISIAEGRIIKNPDKFNEPYMFHSVRRDNIIGVLTNEIEPLTELTRKLKGYVYLPASYVSSRIASQFLEKDRRTFEDDYSQFRIEGESKGPEIGRPVFLKRPFSRKGIILVHGYMAAPEEMRVLADALYKNGYTVYCARLRGHGTSPEDLAGRSWEEWYNSVNNAYVVMKNTVKDFAIAGFSTGAGISLLQAANKQNKFKGVISINAPLKLQNIKSHLSSAVVFWNRALDRFKIRRGKMEYMANEPENPHINYTRNPINGINELGRLMDIVEERLPDITIPSLIIQGSNDPVVNPASGLEIFDKIGARNRKIVRIYSERHGIVRGEESEKVISSILLFLKEIFR